VGIWVGDLCNSQVGGVGSEEVLWGGGYMRDFQILFGLTGK
jgi:hypothetical protein